ncbi:NTP transferase domain-containing protein [Candidatus Woesearchaeota archaeon]|nr:NTP transferase domain-containing protein [Candidatus Woesearchaeota archaeon]
MIAIILAAGLGTRLMSLTKTTPKCLVKVSDKSMLDIHIDNLKRNAVKKIWVVVGSEGKCWTKKNIDEIKKKVTKVVVNNKNLETKNAYSLKITLDKIKKKDSLLVVDADLITTPEVIKNISAKKGNIILSKTEYNVENKNNIILNKNGKVRGIKRDRRKCIKNRYGTAFKIAKKDFQLFKQVLNQDRFESKDLTHVLREFIKKRPAYITRSNDWINVNRRDELKKAKYLVRAKPFIIIMMGYTATGKSTVVKKLAKILNTDIFHSAITRQELGLKPAKSEAGEFFDLRSKKREKVDKRVYGQNAKRARNSIKKGKSVILDAGYFFKWQRNQVYDMVSSFGPDVFIIRILCKDENEIKRRFEERLKRFDKSTFNEAPTWNVYVSSKKVTEMPYGDVLPNKQVLNIIEYDTWTKKIKSSRLDNTHNAEKIITTLKKIAKENL